MSEPITDLTFLKNFTGEDPQKMKKYIEMFLQYAPPLLTKMKDAVEAKEWSELRSAAHSIKPQFSYMGMETLKESIQKIEDYAGSESNLEQVPGLVAHIDNGMQQAFAELETARDAIS